MFTVHTLDRDGNPHTELLSTKYVDIVIQAAMGLAKSRWSDEMIRQLRIPVGERAYVILDNGKPWKFIQLAKSSKKVFKPVDAPKEA